ncbi:hypothetical protein [Variovorax saccharolyticus]|uniref:hypothetical protein n=1 Tax=Variovorax saccharolyticus TaxID=3053516 RepID=UPI002577B4CD|nr:hypothetical protein [Variovorax sp. J22R187]MDM0018176.1 hypothetical protein [Variovorax sp. J22R187]
MTNVEFIAELGPICSEGGYWNAALFVDQAGDYWAVHTFVPPDGDWTCWSQPLVSLDREGAAAEATHNAFVPAYLN